MKRVVHAVKKVFGDFRLRYIPPLAVYFAFGAGAFSSVAYQFWEKKVSGLSQEDIVSIGFWAGLPWMIKMIFGHMADSVAIFGSRRKIYMFLGAGLVLIGQGIMADLARGVASLVLPYGSIGGWYLVSGVLSAVGFMLQDVVADTLTKDVVPETDSLTNTPRSKEDINIELGYVQWLGRTIMMFASALLVLVGGWLAPKLGYQMIFTVQLFICAIPVVVGLFFAIKTPPKSEINWMVLGGGMLFGVFVISMGFVKMPYSQEIIFSVSLAVITFLISRLGITREIVFAAIVIFLFRATPGPGPGVSWWMIDVFKFDENFFGMISSFGAILSILGLVIFRKPLVEKSIRFNMIWLILALALVGIPNIGLYYGMNEWIGVSPKTFVFFDTTVSAPLGQLSMVLLLTLTVQTCPTGKQGTWFALMASFMNAALSLSQILTRYLTDIFPIERGNYGNVGKALIASWSIALVIPLLAVLIFLRKEEPAPKQAIH